MNRNLRILRDTPPWEWPEDAGKTLLGILRNAGASKSDLLAAAELAGNIVVVNDKLVGALLSILQQSDKPEKVRATAATSLGPVLEYADTEGFEDEGDAPITERTFHNIQESLLRSYTDAEVPTEVRRRVLEASVRSPQEWHKAAIAAAYRSEDEAWRLTAVFCMRFVRGFDDEILEALGSNNPEIRCEAVQAAGAWELDAAWPHVVPLVTSDETDKPLLLAAIEAAAYIRPLDALDVLADLAESDDEDIADAAHEAIAMAEASLRGEEADDEIDDDDDEDDDLDEEDAELDDEDDDDEDDPFK